MKSADLRNRRVAIWGYGKEGKATLNYLRAIASELQLAVLSDAPIQESEQVALKRIGVECFAGSRLPAKLCDYDIVIKSPGISLYRGEVADATRKGVTFTSSTNIWLADNPTVKTICVTGSKGKSTTSSLIFHILKESGYSVALAGNIGKPLIELDCVGQRMEYVVVEISSYQAADLTGTPSVAVVLNLFEEHLDWHGTVGQYHQDKMNIVRRVRDGLAVLNNKSVAIKSFVPTEMSPIYFNHEDGFHCDDAGIFEAQRLIVERRKIKLRGEHNLSNMCAAMSVGKALGIDTDAMALAVCSFEPLSHRMEQIGTRNGISYVDDSISTIPESTIAALQGLRGREITLLVGGYDRGVNYSVLAEYLCANPICAVIAMPSNGERIIAEIRREQQRRPRTEMRVVNAKSLEEALVLSRRLTPSGGTVLLSPAASSYDKYANFEERADLFRKLALEA